jgi:gliding-associated putative ABC transporter substrate-binding component GldG
MSNSTTKVSKIYNWVLLLIIVGVVIFLNIIGTFIYVRADMTEDERYSLSAGTIHFLEKMNPSDASSEKSKSVTNRLYIKIYLQGNLPAEIKRFRNAIEDKLVEFKEIAGDRIEYEFIDPSAGTEADQNMLKDNLYAKGKGIMPLEIMYDQDGGQSQMMLWPGAEIDYGGVTKGYVQLLPGSPQGQPVQLTPEFSETTVQNSINNLEYMLVSALRKVIQNEKPRIAFIQGHGELRIEETQRIRSLIDDYYTIEDITLHDSLKALNGVKGVIVARPRTAYSDKDLYILDQFVMRGGRLMVFMDKLDFPTDTLYTKGTVHTTRTNLGIDKLLFDYGIKTNDNYVIDAKCTPIVVPFAKENLLPWFFYVASSPTRHPISRNIEPVMLRYASQIQLIPGEKRLVSPVLTTSTNSNVTGLAPIVSLGMPLNYMTNSKKPPILVDNPENPANKICLAGLSEGYFHSHFRNRLVDAFAKNPEVQFKDTSIAEGKILIVSNGDFLRNWYDSTTNAQGVKLFRPNEFNNLRYDEVMASFGKRVVFGNQEFFQNMIDYMMGDNSVLDIRSKQIDIHPIDKEKVKADQNYYKFLNMLLPSGLVLLFAFILFYLRKRRYARS